MGEAAENKPADKSAETTAAPATETKPAEPASQEAAKTEAGKDACNDL